MARYCVHLDEVEFTVDCDGDESDAIRTAREQNGVSEVRTQRAHRLPDAAPEADATDVPADPAEGSQDAAQGSDGSAPAAPKTNKRRSSKKAAPAPKAE